MGGQIQNAARDEIVALARDWKYDHYLAATLAPHQAKDDLILIAAFAGDVERIVMTVSEPAIAAIRLEWWREAFCSRPTTATGSPLADLLRDTIDRRGLTQRLFLDYIDAQETELYSDLLLDLEALGGHFIKREGALFALAMRIVTQAADGESDGSVEAAIAAGAKACGLARTAAQLPWRFLARQFLVPADITARYAIQPGDRINAACSRAIQDELAEAAEDSLAEYRMHLKKVPRGSRVALLPIALTGMYLAWSRRHLDAAEAFELEQRRFIRAWHILKAHWRLRSC